MASAADRGRAVVRAAAALAQIDCAGELRRRCRRRLEVDGNFARLLVECRVRAPSLRLRGEGEVLDRALAPACRHCPESRQIHGQEPARTPTLPFNPALRGLPAPEPPSPGTGRKSGMHRPVRPDRWPARNPPLTGHGIAS